MANQQVDDSSSWLDDPFLTADVNLDLSSLSPAARVEYLQKFRPDSLKLKPADPFEALEPGWEQARVKSAVDILTEDPSVREELLERGVDVDGLEQRAIQEAADRFVDSMESEFEASEANVAAIIELLCQDHLGHEVDDLDQARRELLRARAWTTENLIGAFKKLKAAGELAMRYGHTKALSGAEEREVVSVLQSSGVPAAIIEHLVLATGTQRPRVMDYGAIKREFPQAMNDAMFFVWRSSTDSPADLGEAEFQQFRSAVEARHPHGLSYTNIVSHWDHWKRQFRSSPLFPNGRSAPEPQENFDNLSDEALAERIRDARASRRQARGY